MLLGESTEGSEGTNAEDHLWVSWRGEPLAETGVYFAITSRTKAAFGTAIPPHRFRDSAVTSLGETDPELVWLALALLHQADRRIAEKHYDQARNARAVGLWQEHVRKERRAVLDRKPGRVGAGRSRSGER